MEARVEIERIGLGTAALGRPAYMSLGHEDDLPPGRSPESMERHAHLVFDAAFRAGIRYFDTARSYGRGEEFLRSWLDARGLRPGEVRVGSKWGYRYVGEWRLDMEKHEVKEHSLAMLRRQLAESKERLGEHLWLYQIHSATEESGVLEDDAILDELARLRDEGLRIGLTTSGPDQAKTVRRALRIRRGGARLFESIQSTWNLFETSCAEALREARDEGVTVMLKEVFANGRLSPRASAPAALVEVAEEYGATVDAIAVAAALAQDFADRLILGAATPEQLASNLVGATLRLHPDQLARLATLREESEAYWKRRAGIPWS